MRHGSSPWLLAVRLICVVVARLGYIISMWEISLCLISSYTRSNVIIISNGDNRLLGGLRMINFHLNISAPSVHLPPTRCDFLDPLVPWHFHWQEPRFAAVFLHTYGAQHPALGTSLWLQACSYSAHLFSSIGYEKLKSIFCRWRAWSYSQRRDHGVQAWRLPLKEGRRARRSGGKVKFSWLKFGLRRWVGCCLILCC